MLCFLTLSWQVCARVRPPRQHAFTTTPAHSTFVTASTSDTSVACASSPPRFRFPTAVLGFGHKLRTLPSRSRCHGSATRRSAPVGSSSPLTGTIFVTRFQTTFLFFPTAGVGCYVITMRRLFTSATATPNRRPRFPLGVRGEFGYSFCAPPACPTAVGEAQRSASSAHDEFPIVTEA